MLAHPCAAAAANGNIVLPVVADPRPTPQMAAEIAEQSHEASFSPTTACGFHDIQSTAPKGHRDPMAGRFRDREDRC